MFRAEELEAQQALKCSTKFNRITARLQHTSTQLKSLLMDASEAVQRASVFTVNQSFPSHARKMNTFAMGAAKRNKVIEHVLREQRIRWVDVGASLRAPDCSTPPPN